MGPCTTFLYLLCLIVKRCIKKTLWGSCFFHCFNVTFWRFCHIGANLLSPLDSIPILVHTLLLLVKTMLTPLTTAEHLVEVSSTFTLTNFFAPVPCNCSDQPHSIGEHLYFRRRIERNNAHSIWEAFKRILDEDPSPRLKSVIVIFFLN